VLTRVRWALAGALHDEARMKALLLAIPISLMFACERPPSNEKPIEWMSDKRQTAQAAEAAAAPAVAAPSAASAAKEATDIFGTRCMPCHGASGAGDGPASAGLTPKPANFRDPAWQQKVTDDHIEKVVSYGGMAVGKSAAMPPNPDLANRPEIIQALREHIRGLGK